MNVIGGVSDVMDRYDLFLVDQWGVLHNGESALPGAVDVLRALRGAGKTIIILSNSGKRVSVTKPRMHDMGFTPDLYDHCVTSGEEVWQALHARTDPFYRELGRRCLMFSWDGDKRLMDGLQLTEVADVSDADFILNAGTRSGLEDVSEFDGILQDAASRDLPMICANPDFVSVAPDGSHAICPGTTARRYEQLGGRVDYRGKPHMPVYTKCFALAGNFKAALAIGDSLHHDIAGANKAGIDSLFISSGIHGDELGTNGLTDPASLTALFDKEEISPTYTMARIG